MQSSKNQMKLYNLSWIVSMFGIIGRKEFWKENCNSVRTNEDETEELPGVGNVTQPVQKVHHDLEPSCRIKNIRFSQ